MGDSILSIGLSGLGAAQAGLVTTGHNISNVNTDGYSRQQAIQATRLPLYTGNGYFGQGVDVDNVQRTYSSFLAARTVRSQADSSELSTLDTQLSQLDNLFGDPTSGLSPAIDQFFAGINALSANPGDRSARQSALSGAQSLVSRFQQIDAQLSALRTSSNDQVRSAVTTTNTLSAQLANLNRRILESNTGDGTLQPNDLLDQRDLLVRKLNEQIGAHATVQSDGSYNIFLSNGLALVVGSQANALAAVPDPQDPQDVQVALQTGGGFLRFESTDFSGGAIAGTLRFRDQYLADAQNGLGRIAVVLGTTFNAQHVLGQDINGALGGAFFGVPTPVVKGATTNTGTAVVGATVSDAPSLTTSDYRLQYDGANYQLTRTSDGVTQTFAALPQTVDGISIALTSGAPAAGDTFLIEPTRTAAGSLSLAIKDPAKIAAAAPIRTATGAANTGSGSMSLGSVDAGYLAAPLAAPVTLTYASATNQLTGFPAVPVTVTNGGVSTTYAAGVPVPYVPDATIAFGGISFTLAGGPANGDTFAVLPNSGGIGDGRNLQLLSGLSRQNVVAGRTATYQGAYAALVSSVGSASRQASIESDAQSQLLAQAQAAQSSASGVNLDEEAANLQRFQQAYQAAGKLVSIAAAMFDTILEMGKQ